MNLINEFLTLADILVNKLSKDLNEKTIDLAEAEQRILKFIYQIGHTMLTEVIENIVEPITENRLIIDGKLAIYKGMQSFRLKNRFGDEIVGSRRRYQLENQGGGYYPLDEKLGIDNCVGFTPLMTYLLSFFGGCDSFGASAKALSKSLGFSVSATAVQRNTEFTGNRIADSPLEIIPSKHQSEECELMVVEIDGTTSPQIHQEEGITGRESMKQPTEYKECNVVVIEKWNDRILQDRWTGARYGKRTFFEDYVRQGGLKMGQLKAQNIAFVADGAKHNWDIQQTNFPDAVAILDFYHASEHLASFCNLLPDKKKGAKQYKKWRSMMLDGDILQLLVEMKNVKPLIKGSDCAQKEINYFENNKKRMKYDEYKEKGFPIGSGLVEGSCKMVVGKRFKGNGMRWKKDDNAAVLKVRLAVLNNQLADYLKPAPRSWKIVS